MTNTMNAPIPANRRVGSVLGLALADAYGDPLEFRSYGELLRRFPEGPSAPDRFRITDDTQMSLSVWSALEHWDGSTLGMLRQELCVDFIGWLHDKDNNRAPGATCMSALARLERLGQGGWTSATSPGSAGCGSVMRAPWVGLHPKVSDDMVTPVALLQAVLTHGNAESYTAAAAAELTRALARDEVRPGGCAEWLRSWAERVRDAGYDERVCANLWQLTKQSEVRSAGHDSPESYVAEGVAHVLWAADAAALLALQLPDSDWDLDPCSIAGEGWRARECFAVAVGIVDGVTDPIEAVRRAAMTGGDSDSIAAVTGALLGAAYGNVWPTEWVDRLESRYARELAIAAG